MYMNKTGALQLKDFTTLCQSVHESIPEKAVAKEIEELADFFERFVITKKQAHILA